jgi:hypothetical protein
VAEMFRDDASGETERKTDELLSRIGNYFLQGAWHEDQEIAWKLSHLFDMPGLRELMEIVFFILGTDFRIAGHFLTPEVLRFFEEVYPQKSLLNLLRRIEAHDMNGLKETENETRIYYRNMNKLFSDFLQTKVNWGPGKTIRNVPFYKILYSNFSRTECLADLKNTAVLQDAIEKLESFCNTTISIIGSIKAAPEEINNEISLEQT